MAHQCVRCSKIYEDVSKEIIQGCSCGSRFFFFMKKQDVSQVQEVTANLTENDKKQIEKDALDLVGEEQPDKPVILDLEDIRITKPGKFELDLVKLFSKKPLVYKLDDGKYVIDLASTFKAFEKDED